MHSRHPRALRFGLLHHETMIDFTKRLMSKLSVPRGPLFMRFPWSLLSIPLILLGWSHFSNRQLEKSPITGVEIAGLVGGSPIALVDTDKKGDVGATRTIVTVSAIDAGAATESGLDADDSLNSTGPSGARDSDTHCRAKIVGDWEDDYQGKRHLTVGDDGSGTMVVELDGIGKKLFAARLTFDLEWSVADGRVVMQTLGGKPASKVQLVLKLYGNEAEYKILELTDDRMLLLDADGKTKYDWRRPE